MDTDREIRAEDLAELLAELLTERGAENGLPTETRALAASGYLTSDTGFVVHDDETDYLVTVTARPRP